MGCTFEQGPDVGGTLPYITANARWEFSRTMNHPTPGLPDTAETWESAPGFYEGRIHWELGHTASWVECYFHASTEKVFPWTRARVGDEYGVIGIYRLDAVTSESGDRGRVWKAVGRDALYGSIDNFMRSPRIYTEPGATDIDPGYTEWPGLRPDQILTCPDVSYNATLYDDCLNAPDCTSPGVPEGCTYKTYAERDTVLSGLNAESNYAVQPIKMGPNYTGKGVRRGWVFKDVHRHSAGSALSESRPILGVYNRSQSDNTSDVIDSNFSQAQASGAGANALAHDIAISWPWGSAAPANPEEASEAEAGYDYRTVWPGAEDVYAPSGQAIEVGRRGSFNWDDTCFDFGFGETPPVGSRLPSVESITVTTTWYTSGFVGTLGVNHCTSVFFPPSHWEAAIEVVPVSLNVSGCKHITTIVYPAEAFSWNPCDLIAPPPVIQTRYMYDRGPFASCADSPTTTLDCDVVCPWSLDSYPCSPVFNGGTPPDSQLYISPLYCLEQCAYNGGCCKVSTPLPLESAILHDVFVDVSFGSPTCSGPPFNTTSSFGIPCNPTCGADSFRWRFRTPTCCPKVTPTCGEDIGALLCDDLTEEGPPCSSLPVVDFEVEVAGNSLYTRSRAQGMGLNNAGGNETAIIPGAETSWGPEDKLFHVRRELVVNDYGINKKAELRSLAGSYLPSPSKTFGGYTIGRIRVPGLWRAAAAPHRILQAGDRWTLASGLPEGMEPGVWIVDEIEYEFPRGLSTITLSQRPAAMVGGPPGNVRFLGESISGHGQVFESEWFHVLEGRFKAGSVLQDNDGEYDLFEFSHYMGQVPGDIIIVAAKSKIFDWYDDAAVSAGQPLYVPRPMFDHTQVQGVGFDLVQIDDKTIHIQFRRYLFYDDTDNKWVTPDERFLKVFLIP